MGLLWDLVASSGGVERRQLISSVSATQQALRRAYEEFNYATDPELVESCVYAINALEHRHTYLCRQLRDLSSAAPAD